MRRQNREPREYQRVKDRMRLDGAAISLHARQDGEGMVSCTKHRARGQRGRCPRF